MTLNPITASTADLRAAFSGAERGSEEHESSRAALAARIAELNEAITFAEEVMRNAAKNNAPDAEQYHSDRRAALITELDTAFGF